MDCNLPGSSVHGVLQVRILERGSHSLFQGIFLTQGLNSCLLYCREILYCLRHQGKVKTCSCCGRTGPWMVICKTGVDNRDRNTWYQCWVRIICKNTENRNFELSLIYLKGVLQLTTQRNKMHTGI